MCFQLSVLTGEHTAVCQARATRRRQSAHFQLLTLLLLCARILHYLIIFSSDYFLKLFKLQILSLFNLNLVLYWSLNQI